MSREPFNNSLDIATEVSKLEDRRSSKWDIANIPKNYISLVLLQSVSALFAFASVWLINKEIGPEGYGSLVAVIAASQVAQILVNWTSYTVVRFGTEEFIETNKIARAFWGRLYIFIFNYIVVISCTQFWFPPLAGWLKLPLTSFCYIIFYFTVSALWIHVQYSMQGIKLFRTQGWLLMIERVLVFSGIIIGILLGNLDTSWVILCYAISPMLLMLVGIWFLKSYIFTRFKIDYQYIKKSLLFALPLLPFSLIGYFSTSYVDAIFISSYLTTRELGFYSVATQINGLTLQFPTLANLILLPLFITLFKEKENQRIFNYFNNILSSLTFIWGIICTTISFSGCFLIPQIFGSEFQVIGLPLWILLAASVISFPVLVGYSALSNSISKTYIAMYAALVSATANVIVNIWMIPEFGMVGCAFATYIAYLLSLLIFVVLLNHSKKIPLGWVYWAILPSAIGTITFVLSENSMLSFIVCLLLSFIIGVIYRNSLIELFKFSKIYFYGLRIRQC